MACLLVSLGLVLLDSGPCTCLQRGLMGLLAQSLAWSPDFKGARDDSRLVRYEDWSGGYFSWCLRISEIRRAWCC